MNKKILFLPVLSMACCLTSCFDSGNKDNGDDKPVNPPVSSKTVNSIIYDGETFKWTKPSSEITGYQLYIGEQSFDVEENSYGFRGDKNFDLKIACKTAKETYETTSFTFKYGGDYSMPTYSDSVLSWKSYPSAEEYKLNLNDEIISTKNNTYTEKLKTGKNEAKVKPVILNESEAIYYSYSQPLKINLLASPQIMFDKVEGVISWNQVPEAKGYSLMIKKDGEQVVDVPQLGAEATEYNRYHFEDAGEYEILICARGDASKGLSDSAFSSKIVKKLETPKNVKTEEKAGNILLTWDPVDGADEYIVKLPNGEESSTRNNSYSFPITDSVNQERFHFNILSRAMDNLVLDSNETANIELTRLEKVRNIKLQDGYVVWDAVPTAQSYVINIDGREYSAPTNKYQILVAEGTHIVKVKAIGDMHTVISSTYSNEVKIMKLSSPQNVRFENGVLRWDVVPGATNYNVVSKNGNVNRNTTDTQITINSSEITESTSIYVVARGNGNLVLDSDPSDTKPAYKLATPNIKLNKSGVEWNAIAGATEYELKVGDYFKRVKGTSYNLNEFEAGSYVCEVKAIGDGQTYFDSRLSTPVTANVLKAPLVQVNDNKLTWGHVSLSDGYEVFVDGEEIISLPFNKREFIANFKTAGTHTISVRAVGDGSQSCTSKWTQITVNSELLIAPLKVNVTKADDKHFNVTWDEVANNRGYVLLVNGIETYCETNSYLYEVTTDGNYNLSVKALGNGYDFVDSNPSKEITFTILSPVTNTKMQLQDVDFYTLTWSPTSKATGYSVKVTKTMKSGGEPEVTTKTVSGTSMDIDTAGVASIKIEIVALGDNINIYNSQATVLTKYFN